MLKGTSKKITILNKRIAPGETIQLQMDIARLNTRSKINIPVIVSRGKNEGPTLLLIGGIHGDETNGVEIVRQIIANGFHKPTSGTVVCIPLLNVFGFLNNTREFPDGRDLNRVFPGSKKGSLASRFAHFIMEKVIPDVDYCIDFHTGAAQRFNYPQIRIDGLDEETMELAHVFEAPFIVLSKGNERTIRKTITKMNKKILLFEGGKALNLNNNVTTIGVQGALKVMHKLGMRDFSTKINKTNETKSILIKDSKWIRAKHSGMFRSCIVEGQKIEKGIKLGSISDPFGDFEKTFKNSQEGYVLNVNQAPVVNQGDAILHIGFE